MEAANICIAGFLSFNCQSHHSLYTIIVSAKVITGYRVRNGVWTLLGKGDPQAPQVKYIKLLHSDV